MNSLPIEVFGEIFFHLHQNDKLECMLVCRYWKQLLERRFLYHTCCVFSKKSLYLLTEKVQEKPEIAYQIERLVIYYQKYEANLSTVLSLLPKIKSLLFAIGDFNDLIINEKVQYSWSKHIKHIHDSKMDSIAYHLLLSNTCPNLTTLSISDYSQNIIPLLKNAPALKSLTLSCGIVSLNDLELIHQNAPSIRSLVIHGLSLNVSDLGKTIEPATSVTECIFTNMKVFIFKMRIDLLAYICKKYPNLSKLEYNIKGGTPTDEDIDKFNQHGWIPLFQSLGPQLKTFGICDGGYIENLFEEMDKFSFQNERLKLWTLPSTCLIELAQSQQILHIQTLVLNDMAVKVFGWLKKLHALKKFKLCSSRHSSSPKTNIDLADILENTPPTLKSLSFHNLSLDADTDYTDLSHIEKLSFFLVRLPDNIDGYISSHFPKLSTLKLKNCRQIGKNFNLDNLHLFTFRFTEYFKFNNNNIMVMTLHNNECRYYSVNNANYGMSLVRDFKPFSPPLRSLSANGSCPNSVFTLYCNSLKNISFK